MKARMFVLTTSVAFALVVPAAHAATASNWLYRTKVQTVLWDKTHHLLSAKPVSKTHASKRRVIKSKAHANPAVPTAVSLAIARLNRIG